MSVSYFANWMGPLNQRWLETNGDNWALGRIDISGIPSHPFGMELPIPPMRSNHFTAFARFLNKVSTEEALPLETLTNLFQDHHAAIEWLKNDNKALSHRGNGMYSYQVTRDRLDGRGEKHLDWASCRIDVFSTAGDKLSLANQYVPLMRADDMTSFGSFVNLLRTSELKTPQELARAYEATGNNIRWRRPDHHGIQYWE